MTSRLLLFLTLIIAAGLAGCVSGERVSFDHDYNYSEVFFSMHQPKPQVLNSRLDRYTKTAGLWTSRERNGEWEFEMLASRSWVEEVKAGFIATRFSDYQRKPTVAWWTPTEEEFEAYQMPYSSYSAAHLYIEKHPKDESRIRIFIQRH